MSKKLKISVNELLAILRGALLSIIPWIEKAKIKWKEGEAYDDWDNIADTLYKNIVCSSLTGEVASDYSIAKYNLQYENYTSIDFIEVRSKGYSENKFAFIAFQSNSSPLDTIRVAELDKTNKVVGYTNLKFESLEFVFVKNINGKKDALDSVEVIL